MIQSIIFNMTCKRNNGNNESIQIQCLFIFARPQFKQPILCAAISAKLDSKGRAFVLIQDFTKKIMSSKKFGTLCNHTRFLKSIQSTLERFFQASKRCLMKFLFHFMTLALVSFATKLIHY